MVTFEKHLWDGKNVTAAGTIIEYVEGSCLSGDTKPTNVANGSKLLELDTSKLYVFDQANSIWREWV